MWLLNLTVYIVIFLGWGVCLYALAVGVNDLYRKIKDKKKTVTEMEREYYVDIFSQILHEYDQDDYPESLEKILGTLKTYVDGVHQIKPASTRPPESVIRSLTSWGETFREVINSSHSDSSEEYMYKIGHLSVDMEDLLEDFIEHCADMNDYLNARRWETT